MTPAAARLYFLDWLRIAAFAMLVPYHVGMYYVRWPFHVKSPFASATLEPWMLLSSPWRMSLIFLIAGAVTSLLLQGGTGPAFLRSRSRRLLLPLLCGVLLVVPPQAFFQARQQYGFEGGFWQFLGLYYTHYQGFCRGGQCLVLPTWNHLWFLPYLWCYTVLLWAALRLRPGLLDRLAGHAAWLLPGARMLWAPMLLLLALRWLLFRRFPETHDLVHDGFWHPVYGLMFLGGAVLVRTPGAWQAMARWRWPALGLALVAWALFVTLALHGLGGGQRGVVAMQQWGALVALLGFGYQHLNRDHPWRATLNAAVFPVYILHQTLLIVLSQWLAPLAWTPGLEAPVLIVATFALSLLGFAAVRRVDWVRPWFGLERRPGPAT